MTILKNADAEPDEVTVRGKWMYQGCGSIDEMIENLEREKESLQELKGEGYEFTQGGGNDDYTILRKESP